MAGLVALCCLVLSLGAEELWHADEGWGLNLPEGWVLLESRSDVGNLNFADPVGHAILQVFQVKGSAVDFAAGVQTSLKVKPVAGSDFGFRYNQRQARLIEAAWQAGKNPVHGYIVAINAAGQASDDGAFVLVAFAREAEFDSYKDALQSLLDSFFIGQAATYLPGPISQMTANDGWHGGPLGDLDTAVAVSQMAAEREARILATFQTADFDSQKKAWRRFYQMIWKDNYSRLDDVAERMAAVFKQQQTPRDRIPLELLAWIQSFGAETYTSLADLRVPVDAANRKLGDCDARGLVYLIILEHLGYRGILMVSSVYHHSMVGLDYQAAGLKPTGATFALDGQNWLVAETMTSVPLGQIRQDMADPTKWLGFDMHFKP